MSNSIKNIRIKDIAQMAGVSEGTVDRVLHNRGNVSLVAQAKVNSVLTKIHYKPNVLARSLGKVRNLKISVIIPEYRFDPYWGEVKFGIAQAQDEWNQYGVTIEPFYYLHDGNLSLEQVAKEALKARPNGMVLAPIFYPQAMTVIASLHEMKIPYVLFNTNIPESKPLSFIGQDLRKSGRLAGQLMGLDHKENDELVVMHIGESVKDSIYLMEKENGFKEFYNKERHPFKITSLNIDASEKSLSEAIVRLVKNKNIKGLFVTTSKSVATVASILLKNSRTDIRLIGYDMLKENLKYLKKGVISFLINQNPKRQAFVGISHMANHLLFKKNVPHTDLFPLEVIMQENIDSYVSSGIH
ncbi:MAG: LacI family DNA-binding transcriptional regulator [Cyclobacteriaceae bacterium]|nr:LacI family DNA-binding transcriptional regulator [Cyclobacteriaceae bacterium]